MKRNIVDKNASPWQWLRCLTGSDCIQHIWVEFKGVLYALSMNWWLDQNDYLKNKCNHMNQCIKNNITKSTQCKLFKLDLLVFIPQSFCLDEFCWFVLNMDLWMDLIMVQCGIVIVYSWWMQQWAVQSVINGLRGVVIFWTPCLILYSVWHSTVEKWITNCVTEQIFFFCAIMEIKTKLLVN